MTYEQRGRPQNGRPGHPAWEPNLTPKTEAISFQTKHEPTRQLRRKFANGASFRRLKTESIPMVGYMSAALAKQDVDRYLM